MKYLLVTLLLIVSTVSFGQQLTLNYLISLKNKSLDEFETIFLKKGWNPEEETESNDIWVTKIFTKRDEHWYYLSLSESESGKKRIKFGLTNTKLYLSIKQQAKANLFVYLETFKTSKGTYSRYVKGNILIDFESSNFTGMHTSKDDYTIFIDFN